MTRLGLIILTGSWLPRLAVGLMDPASNPIGLGLLAMAGTVIGVLLIVLGLIVTLLRSSS